MASFDRYSQVREGNTIRMVPFGEVPEKSTDHKEIYVKGKTRLDKVSYDYYGNPDYGWLIMQANPEYGSLEFAIPDGAELRIPFPLESSLRDYQASIDKHKKLYN